MASKNKKAQFKIQQMAFMLIAVMIFFVLVGLFFLTMRFSDISKRASDLEQEKAISLALSIAKSPEFSCGESERGACVDFDKIIILKDKKIFYNLWPVSKIELRKIYPSSSQEVKCTIQNYPDCNFVSIYNKKKNRERASASGYVQLCRKEKSEFSRGVNYVYDKCELGELIIKI